ncbi:MAG: hypothetical protein RLZZ33_1721 [Pseudomonadota bacterium]|jgi:uncharacterized membrane protein
MTDNVQPPEQPTQPDFFSSDAKVAECRRQSDQLNYFAHSYCKIYGEWLDAIARLQEERQRQPLLLVLIAAIVVTLMTSVYVVTSNPVLTSMIVILGAALVYGVLERVRREEERFDEIKRSKDRFSTTLYLAGVDLHLAVLEDAIAKNTAGEWVFNSKFNDWRAHRLNSIFYRVYGTAVPKTVIDKICSYGA